MPWPFSQVRTVSPVCHRSSIRSEGNALQVPKSEDQRPTQTRLPFCRPYPPPSGRAIGVQIPLVTVMILPLGKVANLACTLMSAAHASSASMTALSNRTGKSTFRLSLRSRSNADSTSVLTQSLSTALCERTNNSLSCNLIASSISRETVPQFSNLPEQTSNGRALPVNRNEGGGRLIGSWVKRGD